MAKSRAGPPVASLWRLLSQVTVQLSRLPPRYPHNIAYFSQFLQGKAANCSASLLPRERVATPASSSQPDCLPASQQWTIATLPR
jgi:hypothetical protein